jgi:F-type H+-transporting ATPase subunit b
MRRLHVIVGSLLVGLLLGSALAPLHAADSKKETTSSKGKPGEGGGPKVEVVFKQGKQVFDLADPAQCDALINQLKTSEVEHVTIEKPASFMEQMADLGLWSLIVFGLLFALLRWKAWKPMVAGLQKREHTIQQALDDARQAREEAERLRAQFQTDMSKAHEQATAVIEEARRNGQHMVDEQLAKAKADIQAERDRLRREIETARDQALQDIWNQTARLATDVSAKVIRRELTPEDHRRLVDEALTELGRANVGWKERSLY